MKNVFFYIKILNRARVHDPEIWGAKSNINSEVPSDIMKMRDTYKGREVSNPWVPRQ